MRRIALLATVAVALAVAGCGSGAAPVSGTVTLDGKPVEGASVTFTPESGDGGGLGGSYGRTDAQGRYSLRTVAGDKDGAAAGKHKVTISLSKEDPDNPEGIQKDLIPARYNVKSELTFDVPSGGTDKADFPLKK